VLRPLSSSGIVGIFASNLFAAEGTATGIRQVGKQNWVKVVGFDAGPDQIKAPRDGTVQALIAQQPETIGTDGVQQALKALKGGQNEAKIGTGFTVITKSNIDSPEGKAAATRPAAERSGILGACRRDPASPGGPGRAW